MLGYEDEEIMKSKEINDRQQGLKIKEKVFSFSGPVIPDVGHFDILVGLV